MFDKTVEQVGSSNMLINKLGFCLDFSTPAFIKSVYIFAYFNTSINTLILEVRYSSAMFVP